MKPLSVAEHFGFPNGKQVELHEEYTGKDSVEKCFKKQSDKICFKYNHGEIPSLQTSFFIGLDWIEEGGYFLHVNPKVDTTEDKLDFFEMLKVAASSPVKSDVLDKLLEIDLGAQEIEIDQNQDYLSPLLLIHFLSQLRMLVKNGLKKGYYVQDQNLDSKVKGKILALESVRKNHLKGAYHKTYCRIQIHGVDILENRLLKKALDFAVRYSSQFPMRLDSNILNYVRPAFKQVSSDISGLKVNGTSKSPFYSRYDYCLKLANLILRRYGYNINSVVKSEKVKTPPYWIDMSLLFELYALNLLRHKEGGVEFQFHGKYGYPDFLLLKRGFVADAKYSLKYNEERYQAESIRQISGYARDIKVRAKLGTQPNQVVPCLIIHPDQNAKLDWNDITKAMKSIPQFEEFYKLGIPLPVQ